MDLVELVRLLRQGASDRTLTRVLRHNRRTIAKYREWASQQGLLAGELPSAVQLQALHAATLPTLPPPQQRSTVEAYRDEIAPAGAGLEAAAIRVRLEETHGHAVSYSAVWRLLQRLCAGAGDAARERGQGAVVRVEVRPATRRKWTLAMRGSTWIPAAAWCARPGSSSWCWPLAGTSTPNWSSTNGWRPGCCATSMPLPASVGCHSAWCPTTSRRRSCAPALPNRRPSSIPRVR